MRRLSTDERQRVRPVTLQIADTACANTLIALRTAAEVRGLYEKR